MIVEASFFIYRSQIFAVVVITAPIVCNGEPWKNKKGRPPDRGGSPAPNDPASCETLRTKQLGGCFCGLEGNKKILIV